jgi:hypothetical protein
MLTKELLLNYLENPNCPYQTFWVAFFQNIYIHSINSYDLIPNNTTINELLEMKIEFPDGYIKNTFTNVLKNINIKCLNHPAFTNTDDNKTSLFNYFIQNDNIDINTIIFCFGLILNDGYMNTYLTIFLEKVLVSSKTTNYPLIALLISKHNNTILSRCTYDELDLMWKQWEYIIIVIGLELDYLWKSYIHTATIQYKMIVLSPNVSSQWNRLSDKWNYARNQLLAISEILGRPIKLPIYRCIHVTHKNRGLDDETIVFIYLAKLGLTPWIALDDPTYSIDDIIKSISDACNASDISTDKWYLNGVLL